MYTDCPGCQRQFHIYAAQISAAGGQVKCGFCGVQFNAMERLRDKPLPRPKPQPPASTTVPPLPEPEFTIPDAEGAHTTERTPEEPDSMPIARTSRDGQAPDDTSKGTLRPSRSWRPKRYEFTETSQQPPQPETGRFSRTLWAIGSVFLLLGAVSQIIWFNRDAIMGRYPRTVSWYNRLCATVNCSAIRNRDLAVIRLLNRDVREHPRYENSLLVNATMSNQSQTLQPYPIVQLNLYNTDGGLIAYRQFQPSEYLDDTINIAQGMAPNLPVHFVLEILDVAAGAVSFEFEFH